MKPYYLVEFSAAACLFEIRVNDIPVLTLELSGQASSMAPVNFAILNSGNQTFSARILPLPGNITIDPNASLNYQLKLYDIKQGFDYKETILSYQFPKVSQQEHSILQKADRFIATVPYQLKGWSDGKNLNEVDDVKDKIVRAYQKITGFIRNKNYDGLKRALANREEIMLTSMYLGTEKLDKRVDKLISDFENGFELIPFANDLTLQYYANGKVAALRRLNGDHAICAQNIEKDEEILLDLAFYIPEGKSEFEVI
jgi:hypothetical protein